MSLILEALKKSEAERRIGQAPGLSTPMPMRGRRRRARWPVALAIALAAALLLLAGMVWRATNQQTSDATIATSPATASLPDASPPPEQAAPETSAATPVPVVSTTAASAARGATPPASIAAPLPQDPQFVSVERESIALPASGQAPAFVPPTVPAPIIPHADTVATDGAQAPPATPALEALPRLRDLPAGRRDALPPLKLSMHVYTEDPATRFVLIDGRRLGEGASVGNALRIAQIRRDGAVLDFDGTRFILPRP